MDPLTALKAAAGPLPTPAIREWKAAGRPVVGFMCGHVPEEILAAADILPVRLRAPGCQTTVAADQYLSHHNCTYIRACLEFLYTERFAFLDGLV